MTPPPTSFFDPPSLPNHPNNVLTASVLCSPHICIKFPCSIWNLIKNWHNSKIRWLWDWIFWFQGEKSKFFTNWTFQKFISPDKFYILSWSKKIDPEEKKIPGQVVHSRFFPHQRCPLPFPSIRNRFHGCQQDTKAPEITYASSNFSLVVKGYKSIYLQIFANGIVTFREDISRKKLFLSGIARITWT